MYRKVRDNTVAELRVRDGKLMFDRLALIPVDAAAFSSGANKFLFQDRRLNEVTADGDVVYERVEPAHPSDSLAALAGKYESGETGSTLTVAAKAGDLTPRHRMEQTSPPPADVPQRIYDGGRGGQLQSFFTRIRPAR